MITLHRFLMGLASVLALWGMSVPVSAYDSNENEADERSGSHNESHNESAKHEASEHGGSSSESAERHRDSDNSTNTISTGNSSKGNKRSDSSSHSSGPDRDDRNGRRSSNSESQQGAASRNNSTRTAASSRGSSLKTPFASRMTRTRDGGTERITSLRTVVGGRNRAEYNISDRQRSFEIEMANTTLPPGSTLSIYVNDISVGQMTVGRYGRNSKAKLRLDTRFGQSVPMITAGSVVTVKYSTAAIVSGTF